MPETIPFCEECSGGVIDNGNDYCSCSLGRARACIEIGRPLNDSEQLRSENDRLETRNGSST